MEEIAFKVIGVIRETKDAHTFQLEEVSGKKINYEAGQFLTLIVKIKDQELRRSYSICSTPGVDEHLSINVKRVANGQVSRYLLSRIRKGSILRSLPPAGLFVLSTHPGLSRTLVFLAAGNGITPIFSLIKKVLHDEPMSQIILVYQNRNEEQILFYDQLTRLKKYSNFRQLYFLSQPLAGQPTRLNNILLEDIVSSHAEISRPGTLFFLCGPKGFMRMIEFTLKLLGFADKQIRKETFVVEFIPSPTFSIDSSPKHVTLHVEDRQYKFDVRYPKSILQAAMDEGIKIPYSCRGGRCSTCVVRCLKGSVKMSINEVLTEQDLLEGLVLTCVGYAETDLILKME